MGKKNYISTRSKKSITFILRISFIYFAEGPSFFQVLEPENEEFAWEVRITILSYFAIFEFLPTSDGWYNFYCVTQWRILLTIGDRLCVQLLNRSVIIMLYRVSWDTLSRTHISQHLTEESSLLLSPCTCTLYWEEDEWLFVGSVKCEASRLCVMSFPSSNTISSYVMLIMSTTSI